MIELSNALRLAGIDRNRFNYLFAFGRSPDGDETKALRTKYQDTVPGVARMLSRENCLELSFLQELTRAGTNLVAAVMKTQQLLKDERAGSLKRWWVYGESLSPVLSDGMILKDSISSLESLSEELAPRWGLPPGEREPRAKSINIVDLHEIVLRVDQLIARHADEK